KDFRPVAGGPVPNVGMGYEGRCGGRIRSASRRRPYSAGMRPVVVAALGLILVSSVAAAAPAAVQVRTLTTRGRVTGLAADGNRVALIVSAPYVQTGGRAYDCASVSVWE